MSKELTIEQIEDFAELAGGYQDDFGKWIFDDSDDLCKLSDIVLATTSVEMNNLNTMIQMLKTDLAAADAEISQLRSK